MLQREHRHIEQGLALLESHGNDCANDGEVTSFIAGLATHLAAEESLFYPAAEEVLGRALGLQREHHARVRAAIAHAMSPGATSVSLSRRLFALTEAFKLHSRMEERSLHPCLDSCMGDTSLEALGAKLAAFRAEASRRFPRPMFCRCPSCGALFQLRLEPGLTDAEWAAKLVPGTAPDGTPEAVCFTCWKQRLSSFAYLWDGSDPAWCLVATHGHERRIVLQFGPSGPSVRDVAGMREVFDELQGQTADVVWAAARGKETVTLDGLSPMDTPRLTQAARARGLRVEVHRTDTVSHLPYNDTTRAALVIEDDGLAAAVANRMLLAGVRVRSEEVD
jgi:hypothetical protein